MEHISVPFTSISMASEQMPALRPDRFIPSESMSAIHESLQLVYRLVLNDQLPHFKASPEVKALLETAPTTERLDGGAVALPVLQSVQALLNAPRAQSISLPTAEPQPIISPQSSSLLRHERFEARVKDNSEDIFTKEQLMALFGQLRTFSPDPHDAEWNGFVFAARYEITNDNDSFADTYSSAGTISVTSDSALEYGGAAVTDRQPDVDAYSYGRYHADSEDEYVPPTENNDMSEAESEYDPARVTRLTHHPEYDPRRPNRLHDEYDPTQPESGPYRAEYDPTSPVQDSDYDPHEHRRIVSMNTPVVLSHVANIAAPQPSRLSSHFVSKMANAANSNTIQRTDTGSATTSNPGAAGQSMLYGHSRASDVASDQQILANTTARRQTSPVPTEKDPGHDRRQAKLLRREKNRQDREARRARKRMARDALAHQAEQQYSTVSSPSSSRKESRTQLQTTSHISSEGGPQISPLQYAFPPSATPAAFPITPYGANTSLFAGVTTPVAAAHQAQNPLQSGGLGPASALQAGQTLLLRDQLGNYYTAQYRGAQAPTSVPAILAAPTVPFAQQTPYGLPAAAPSQPMLQQQLLHHQAMLQQAVPQQVIQHHALVQQAIPQPIPQAAYPQSLAYTPQFVPTSSTPLPLPTFPRPPY